MKAKEWIIIGLAGLLVFAGANLISAESPADDQLTNFFESYISEKIAKSQSKTDLQTSRSENLRMVGVRAEKEAAFLAYNKATLVDEMIKLDIGQKPYKIEYYLNKRFSEFYDCSNTIAENTTSTNTIEDSLYACK